MEKIRGSCRLRDDIEVEEKPVELQNLPTEVLIAIFAFCDNPALKRLSQSCKRFNTVIEDFVWLARSRTVIVSNQVSNEIRCRSFSILSYKERCRISVNWNTGRYKEKTYLEQRTKFMPWTQLESGILWLSRGSEILALRRRSNSIVTTPISVLGGQVDDVSRFIVKNGKVVSGGGDGSLCAWNVESGCCIFHKKGMHASDIADVDFFDDKVIITGSKDETIKVWSFKDDKIKPVSTVSVGDRVWTVSLKPSTGDILCYGTSGHNPSKSPLFLYDIEKSRMLPLEGYRHRCGSGRHGVLHALWEDPHTLLSCGSGGWLQMYDTRIAKCTNMWADPLDAVLFCLASDHNCTLLCGTTRHGRVQMWDKRHSKPLQMFFMSSTHSSPAYSLTFDPSHLFVALDQSLNLMTFSGHRNKTVDYRHFLTNRLIIAD